MKQDAIVRFYNEEKKIFIMCEEKTTLGELHDFLIDVKAEVLSRMQAVQKQEEAAKVKQPEEPVAEVIE